MIVVKISFYLTTGFYIKTTVFTVNFFKKLTNKINYLCSLQNDRHVLNL